MNNSERHSLYVFEDISTHTKYAAVGADLDESIAKAQGHTNMQDRRGVDYVLQCSLDKCLDIAQKHKAILI